MAWNSGFHWEKLCGHKGSIVYSYIMNRSKCVNLDRSICIVYVYVCVRVCGCVFSILVLKINTNKNSSFHLHCYLMTNFMLNMQINWCIIYAFLLCYNNSIFVFVFFIFNSIISKVEKYVSSRSKEY